MQATRSSNSGAVAGGAATGARSTVVQESAPSGLSEGNPAPVSAADSTASPGVSPECRAPGGGQAVARRGVRVVLEEVKKMNPDGVYELYISLLNEVIDFASNNSREAYTLVGWQTLANIWERNPGRLKREAALTRDDFSTLGRIIEAMTLDSDMLKLLLEYIHTMSKTIRASEGFRRTEASSDKLADTLRNVRPQVDPLVHRRAVERVRAFEEVVEMGSRNGMSWAQSALPVLEKAKSLMLQSTFKSGTDMRSKIQMVLEDLMVGKTGSYDSISKRIEMELMKELASQQNGTRGLNGPVVEAPRNRKASAEEIPPANIVEDNKRGDSDDSDASGYSDQQEDGGERGVVGEEEAEKGTGQNGDAPGLESVIPGKKRKSVTVVANRKSTSSNVSERKGGKNKRPKTQAVSSSSTHKGSPMKPRG